MILVMIRMFIIVVLIAVATSGWGQAMPMGMTGTLMLVSQPNVKKEIRLTKEQEKQIKTLVDDMQKNPSQFGMPDMHYMTRAIDAKVAALLDADQNTRLRELFWQYNGLLALTETDLAAALELSEEVKEAAKSQIQSYNKTVMDSMMKSRGKYDAKEMEKLRQAILSSLAGLLSVEQLEKWKTLQGKPFKFTNMRR